MGNNLERWGQWSEVEEYYNNQEDMFELNNTAYKAYTQFQNEKAASLFLQAANLAKQKNEIEYQSEMLFWAGECYHCNGNLKKALSCFLQAENLGGLDSYTQFYNLYDIVAVALEVPLPLENIRDLQSKILPYKDIQKIGGSKSMVLKSEFHLLSICGKNMDGLSRSQEAFAYRIDDIMPSYDDKFYYAILVDAYLMTGLFQEARDMLYQWRNEGSTKFATTKRDQFFAELRLLDAEGKTDMAWEVLKYCEAEEQYLGKNGLSSNTLYWKVLLGLKLGKIESLWTTLKIYFIRFRNSESLFVRFNLYNAFSSFFIALAERANQQDCVRMQRYAGFWIVRAEKMAQQLDCLLKCDFRTKKMQEMKNKYEKMLQ